MNCPTCRVPTVLKPGTKNFYCPACYQKAQQQRSGNLPSDTNTDADPTIPAGDCEGLVGFGKKTDFLCPRCPETNLQVAQFCGTQVCFCSGCRGFAIDQDSLGALIDILRSSYEGDDDKPTPMNAIELDTDCYCPACFDKMDTFPYCGPGAVVMDTCRNCRLTWFDRGELVKIVRAPGQRGSQASSVLDRPLNLPVSSSMENVALMSLLMF